MANNVSKTPNIVQLSPVTALLMPTTYTVSPSGTAVAALADASDTTYVQETTGVDHLMYLEVAPTQMPAQSRVIYARAVARALRTAGTAKRSWQVALADNTTTGGLKVNGALTKSTLNTSVGQYSGPTRNTLSDNKTVIDQTQLSKGLILVTGVSGSPADGLSYRTTQGYVEVSYDQPPTANVLTSGTFSDTSSPLITWDYFDDLQPQSEYVVAITDAANNTVYYSDHIKSSNTYHQMTKSLPNGTYTVSVRVYQAWNGPGSSFGAVNAATATFTINVLPLPTPNLTATTTPVTANYLTGDTANFAKSLGNWSSYLGTAAWTNTDGSSGKGAMLVNAGSGVTYAFFLSAPVIPLTFGFSARMGSGANTVPANANLYAAYYDASSNFLALIPNKATFTTDPNNSNYTLIRTSGTSVPPQNAQYLQLFIQNLSSTDTMYVDDAFLGVYNVDVALAGETFTDPFATVLFANNHINLLNFDDSSFDNGLPGWQSIANATLTAVTTPVVDGLAALKVSVPSAGTSKVGQYAAAVKWSPNVNSVGIAAQVNGPVTATGKSVLVTAAFYDVNFALLSTTSATAAASAGYSPYRLNAAVPANTAYVSAQISVTGCAAGDIYYVDDVIMTDYVDSSVGWSRGGVITNTINQLSYDDSTMNLNNLWTIGTGNNTLVVSTDQARQGATSLKMIATGAAGQIMASLSYQSSYYIPIDQAYSYLARISVFSPTVSRQIRVYLQVYDAAFTNIGAVNSVDNSVVGAWKETQITNSSWAAYPTAAYVNMYVVVIGCALNEVHYIDTAGIFKLSTTQLTSASSLGWQPGHFPNTDAAPTLHVEYTEDGTTWHPLADQPLLDSAGNFNPVIEIIDYEIKSGVPRKYGATISKQQNGTQLVSAEGFASGALTLTGAWIHAQADPGDTIAHFAFEGGTRQEDIQAVSAATVVQGRPYPFAEFSTQLAATLAMELVLTTVADKHALDALAEYPGSVVVRDNRGRAYIGALGPVSYTNLPYGYQASFTITQSDDGA